MPKKKGRYAPAYPSRRNTQSMLTRFVTNPWMFFGVCFPTLVALQSLGLFNNAPEDEPPQRNAR